jgi:hypothetical protein
LAILTAAVVLVLNPAELLKQSRDATRMSDLGSINQALSVLESQGITTFGSANTVYISIPDPSLSGSATSNCSSMGLPTLPSGYSYQCVSSDNLRKVDGTGWIPAAFSSASALSFTSLPVDPINSTSTGQYYTYVTGGSWDLSASFESSKYKLGGGSDKASTDGGSYPDLYEVGSNKKLLPVDYGDTSLVGYWPLNEGTGTTAYDKSGKGNNGTITNSPTWATWITGSSIALQLNGQAVNPYNNGYVSLSGVQAFGTNFSFSIWFYLNHDAVSRGYSNTLFTESSGVTLYQHNANDLLYFSNGGRLIAWTPTVGAWHNLICSITNAGNISLDWQGQCYGDGANKSISQSGYLPSGSLSVIGQSAANGGSASINGSVRDIRIYNRALSASEIQALYNATK